jgi:hypothetical protein
MLATNVEERHNDWETHLDADDIHLVRYDSFDLHYLKPEGLQPLLEANYSVVVVGTGGWWGYSGQDREYEVKGHTETAELFRQRLHPRRSKCGFRQ